MKKYIIERNISGSNALREGELHDMIARSNQTLVRVSPQAHWIQSFLSRDKSFCVVIADDDAIAELCEVPYFPDTHVSEVTATIDPTKTGGIRPVWTTMDDWVRE